MPDVGPGGAPIEVRLIDESFDGLQQTADCVKAERLIANGPRAMDAFWVRRRQA